MAKPLIDYSLKARRKYHKAYLDLFKVLLAKDPSLYLLSLAPSLQRPPGLPSCCPNFHSPSSMGGFIQRHSRSFQVGVREKAQATTLITFLPHSNVLRLQGFRIDRVDKIVKFEAKEGPWEEDTVRLDSYSYEELYSWEQKCLVLAQKVYDQPEGIPDAHMHTILVDSPASKLPIVRKTYSNYWRVVSKPGKERVYVTEDGKLAFKELMEDLAAICGRNYFSTQGGRVGLGPPGTAPGDRI